MRGLTTLKITPCEASHGTKELALEK